LYVVVAQKFYVVKVNNFVFKNFQNAYEVLKEGTVQKDEPEKWHLCCFQKLKVRQADRLMWQEGDPRVGRGPRE
jgi:hypothetical protein